MLLLEMVGFDTGPWPNVNDWLRRCYSRPSLAAARERD